MRRIHKSIILTMVLAIGLISVADAGISRVARRYNFIQFYGSYSQPVGKYDQLFDSPIVDGANNQFEADADLIYDPTYQFGIAYGQVRNNHIAFSLGFTYTDIDAVGDFADFGTGEEGALNQYDVDFDLNYLFINPAQAKISPFVGLGFNAGITSWTADGYESQNELTMALGVNFGADIVVWESSDKRTFVALSTVNGFQFLASEERPRYLNIGAGLKYYFRP